VLTDDLSLNPALNERNFTQLNSADISRDQCTCAICYFEGVVRSTPVLLSLDCKANISTTLRNIERSIVIVTF